MTKSHPSSAASLGLPHRRDISARQDLLGRELRQLFDGYSQEEVPEDLLLLAQKLEGAFPRPLEEGVSPAPANARPSSGPE